MWLWCSFLSADINDLFDVHYELLNVAHNWRGVGRALRLHPDLLNRIEASTRDVEQCLEKVLSEWLKQEYDTSRFGLPSWQLLVKVVAHPAGGKDHALAEQIARRHNGKWEAVFYTHYTLCMCISTCIYIYMHVYVYILLSDSLTQYMHLSLPLSLHKPLLIDHVHHDNQRRKDLIQKSKGFINRDTHKHTHTHAHISCEIWKQSL